MATAEELRAELAKLEAEEKELNKTQENYDELYRMKNYGKSRLYNGTKIAILLVTIFLIIIGTFGSMHIGPFLTFSMDDFVKFLGSFSPIFITLTGSIGLGGIAKNIAKSISDKKNGKTTEIDGEDLVKSGNG